MTDELSTSLGRIEYWLERLGRSALLSRLRDGATAGRVRDMLRSIDLPSNGQVETLYAWHDGTDIQGAVSLDDIQIFPGFHLLSLEDADTHYQAHLNDSRWSRDWFPMFADGGGDFYVVDLGEEKFGAIRRFRFDESEHPVEFDSIVAMVSTLAAAFERKVFFIDPNGYLEMDDDVYGAVAAEMNPGVAWWTEY